MRRAVPIAIALLVAAAFYVIRARSQHAERVVVPGAQGVAPANEEPAQARSAPPAKPVEPIHVAAPAKAAPSAPMRVPTLPKTLAEAIATKPWVKAKLGQFSQIVVAGLDLKLVILDRAKKCFEEKVHSRGEVYVRVNLIKEDKHEIVHDVEIEPAHATLDPETAQNVTECVEVAARGYERPLVDIEQDSVQGAVSQAVMRFMFPLERDRAVRLVTDPNFDPTPPPIANEGEVIQESIVATPGPMPVGEARVPPR